MKLKRTAAAVVAAVMAFTAVATPLGDNIPALEGAFSAGAYYSVKDSFYPVALTGDGAVDMVNVAVAQAGRKDDDDGWYPSREAWCADFVLDVARVAGQTVAVPDAPRMRLAVLSKTHCLMQAQRRSKPHRQATLYSIAVQAVILHIM